MDQSQKLTGVNKVLRETMLVYLSKSTTTTDIFLCWEMDLLCIFNIVKNMIYNFVRYISKNNIRSQSLGILL